MFRANSFRSPRPSSSSIRPQIKIVQVDHSPELAIEIRLPKSIELLLSISTQKLGLKREATMIFDENMNRIMNIQEISPNQLVFISCTKPLEDEAKNANPLSKTQKTPVKATIQLPLISPAQKQVEKSQFTLQHQSLAASTGTIRDNMRDSVLSMYNQLPIEAKSALESYDEVECLSTNTESFLFQESLLKEFIGPTCNVFDNSISKTTNAIILESIKGLKPEECKFVINGPMKSGKSTILYQIAQVYFMKCQLSGIVSDYLFVPINWLHHTKDITDFSALYSLMVTLTLDSAKISKPELSPFLLSLKQWFNSLITIPSLTPVPPSVQHYSQVLKSRLGSLGSEIHRIWHSKEGLLDFVNVCLEFPQKFAFSIGCKNAVLICDHIDCCIDTISPSGRFEKSKEYVVFSHALSQILSTCPFFVASQQDEFFIQRFKLDNSKLILTERIIRVQSQSKIAIVTPPYIIESDICKGCPAYHAMFDEICKDVELMNANSINKSQSKKFKPIVDNNRRDIIRQKIFRFLSLVGDDEVPKEIKSDIQTTPYFDIHIQ